MAMTSQPQIRQSEEQMRRLFQQIAPGDRVEVEHEIKIGMQRWWQTTAGRVVRTERRRHGLHFQRNHDDKVWSDSLVLTREDGELTTLTMDEFTRLRRID